MELILVVFRLDLSDFLLGRLGLLKLSDPVVLVTEVWITPCDIVRRVLETKEVPEDLFGILGDVRVVGHNAALSSKSRDELLAQLVEEDLVVRVGDPEEVDGAGEALAHSADATNNLEEGTHVDRHLTSDDAMAAHMQVEGLRTELGVEEQNLNIRIVVEVV